ncbi:DUF6542 domain-containing protein [Nocardioides speluncae]|uniref:DUF6542 domain-containing protein n=1 Tax=Nocardioides speluncae TaxID=2670337 RepID=UPI000D6990A5|nr:DUF6542 domain-containing protein [Nocardioides speluncae]
MSHARTVWEEGREPGRQIVALGFACALTAVVVDMSLGGEVSLFFDLCFVALCCALALLVRPGDFFTVGVLPPLLMTAVFLLLGLVSPDAIAHRDDGVIQALVSGLATHAAALVVGYALCLVLLALRTRQLIS